MPGADPWLMYDGHYNLPPAQPNPWVRSSVYTGKKGVDGIDIAPHSIFQNKVIPVPFIICRKVFDRIWRLSEYYLWEQSLFLSGINIVKRELLRISTISEGK